MESKKYCKCGCCGEMCEREDAVKDDCSDTGWLCMDCFGLVYPEMDAEDW